MSAEGSMWAIRKGGRMKMKLQVIGIAALGFLFFGGLAIAAEAREATISGVKGEVFVRQNHGDWKPAQKGMVLYRDDEVKTSQGSLAEVLLDNGAVGSVQVKEKSLFRINIMDEDVKTGDKVTLLDLAIGKVMVHAEKLKGNSKFEVRTPTSTTGVRGTMFEVSVE